MNPLQRVRTPGGDRGAAAVLVAALLASGVLTGLAAVSIDLGKVYAQRRQVQNATDAAAMAATRDLERARFRTVANPVAAARVATTALSVATANAADPTSVVCSVVRADDTVIAPCASTAGWLGNPAAVGVRVEAVQSRDAVFGGVLGRPTLTAAAGASAQVRGVSTLASAFMLCAVAKTDPRSYGEGPAIGLILPGGHAINPASVGLTYTIHDAQVPGCGLQANSFKGLTVDDGRTVPGLWASEQGDRAGPTRAYVSGKCGDADTVGCVVLVPLCYATAVSLATGQRGSLYCIGYGAFQITYADANTHRGIFQGTPVVTGGTGDVAPTSATARVVRLTH